MFRRRREADDRLDAIVAMIEGAKEDLVASVPSPRGIPGRPVADALFAFEEGLRSAAMAIERWDPPPAAEHGRANCAAAIAESLARAERLRLEAPSLDYEGLVAVLADLIAPLEDCAEAARLSGRA